MRIFYLLTIDVYYTNKNTWATWRKWNGDFLIYLMQLINWSIKDKRAISTEHICSDDEHTSSEWILISARKFININVSIDKERIKSVCGHAFTAMVYWLTQRSQMSHV